MRGLYASDVLIEALQKRFFTIIIIIIIIDSVVSS